ncbi:MAG: hypothetical protein WC651_05210 [Candidatus Gracilibacteria bacterium]|jgi:hypothetical protein
MNKPKKIEIDAKISQKGLDIIVNNETFSIEYPEEIWQSYDKDLKEILKDNISYSSTIFLPQILDLLEITYKTSRPISETFLFKNGIYDMPICAAGDGKSSTEYIKKFFNTHYIFENSTLKVPKNIKFENKKGKKPCAIIPFSFGKESMLSVNLAQEIGIKPILVNFIEPSNEFEFFHKEKLIKKFEKETGLKVYTVKYNPGILRYGKHWGLKTDLGWGLQTTEYSLLCLPFANYFNANYIILGNEQSCNDTFFDKEGILSYKAAYDRHNEWTSQQGFLSSLLLGRKIDVISFMEPIYEIAINKILHNRYPEYGKYQMSCMADTKDAEKNRWCENCIKCGYMYALCCAFNFDLKKIGFTKNLFDKEHSHIYDHFFNYNPAAPIYGSQEELGSAFLLAHLNGFKGDSISRFEKELLGKFKQNKEKYFKKYLGIHPIIHNIPPEFKKDILNIFNQELKQFSK